MKGEDKAKPPGNTKGHTTTQGAQRNHQKPLLDTKLKGLVQINREDQSQIKERNMSRHPKVCEDHIQEYHPSPVHEDRIQEDHPTPVREDSIQEDHPTLVHDDLDDLCNDPMTVDLLCDSVKCSDDDLDDLCNDPMTMDLMCDPVKCSDGNTYCRWTIIDNSVMKKSPYDSSMNLVISCDDITIRRVLFRRFPAQESQFLEWRRRHRQEALQHACADPVEVEGAIEKLNNILTWDPRDTECKTKLTQVLALVDSIQHPIPTESILDEIPEVRHEDVIRARLDNEGARVAAFSVLCFIAIWVSLVLGTQPAIL
ncbi:unnamed protein product [Calypogeia fissa]